MRHLCNVLLASLVIGSLAGAEVIRIANFENFPSGTAFAASFTDPASGIFFHDSTYPGFVINHSSTYFGGGNYLSSGIIGEGGMGSHFGFTADLAGPANAVSIDVLYWYGPRSEVILQGFDAANTLVVQQAGPPGSSQEDFPLSISSEQFNIRKFRMVVSGGLCAYDNIRYTIVPEPQLGILTLAFGSLLARRPNRVIV